MPVGMRIDRKSAVEGKSVDLGGRPIIKKKNAGHLSDLGSLRRVPVLYLAIIILGVRGAATLISFFFFSSRRRHTRCLSDWSSDVCSSDLNCRKQCENYQNRFLKHRFPP